MLGILCIFVAMKRIMSIDYGGRRTGVAVTDVLQMIAGALATVETRNLRAWMVDYMSREEVEVIVIGYPRTLQGELAAIVPEIDGFVAWIEATFEGVRVERVDERFTSKLASRVIVNSGIGKMARRDKALVDRVSATIILQEWLEGRRKGN